MSDVFECYLALPDQIYLREGIRQSLDKAEEERPEGIEISEEGIFVKEGNRYRKGYPHKIHVRATDVVKDLIIDSLSLLSEYPIIAVLLFPFRKAIFERFIHFSEDTFQEFYFKPRYYIKTGQMLAQAVAETWNDARLGRISAMIWEYDDRYRYCFQLAFSLLNKENFAKNPRKELRRLCDELIIREEEENTAKKWRAVKKALALLPLKNVVKCINKLDLEAMKLDEDDLHFAQQKKGFNYG